MKRILVVEDETIMRESLRDWLTNSGYEVDTAERGEQALQTIAREDFGVVILDLRLPGKDGLEVLKEAKNTRPQLKGIIITAYPSVQTAVRAMKEGAVDYLAKPFDLNKLEELIRQTLGPVQVEIRPKEKPATPPAEKGKVKPAAIAPEQVPVHLKEGKAHFEAGRYQPALKEFGLILAAVPGNIEARVWLRKTREALLAPQVAVVEGKAPTAPEAKPKECLWMRMGMVAHRICTNDYNCVTCEFDQMMQEKMSRGEAPELDAALEKLKAQPGSQRLCRYALKGEVTYRVCSRLFQCATCEFGQTMEDALQQKLAKLAARREALARKEVKAKA
ncbi:MAG: response regulator [Dehalococcoidales bacterium]|nr:response regulator [Dehalococcoidales bacterium]